MTFALGWLQRWCVEEGLDWNNPTDEDTRILQALLAETLARMSSETVPVLSRSDVGIPARAKITGRCWTRHSRWFTRTIAPELAIACSNADALMLYPVRISNGAGGRPETSEAQYYLSYCAPECRNGRPEASAPGAATPPEPEKEHPPPPIAHSRPELSRALCRARANCDTAGPWNTILGTELDPRDIGICALYGLVGLCLSISALWLAGVNKREDKPLAIRAVQFVIDFPDRGDADTLRMK